MWQRGGISMVGCLWSFVGSEASYLDDRLLGPTACGVYGGAVVADLFSLSLSPILFSSLPLSLTDLLLSFVSVSLTPSSFLCSFVLLPPSRKDDNF